MEEPIIAFLSLKDTGVQLSKVYIHQTDHTLVEPAFSVTDEDLLKEFILARATCQIPLSFLAGGAGNYSRCTKILSTSLCKKNAETTRADPNQTASEEAV